MIDGKDQLPGKEHSGRITHLRKKAGVFKYLRMDITGCYAKELVRSLVRHFIFLEGGQVVLLDRLDCPTGTHIEARFHYSGSGSILHDDGFLIKNGRADLVMKFASSAPLTLEKGRHANLVFREETTAVFVDKTSRTYLTLSTKAGENTTYIASLLCPYESSAERSQSGLKLDTEHSRYKMTLTVETESQTREIIWTKKSGKILLDSVL